MVQPIKLTDAAQYYDQSPHQTVAWEWLQEALDERTLAGFAVRYRNDPKPKPQEPQPGYITPELMESITGHPASSFDASFCNDFNDMLESTGFDQHMDAMQMLMANLCHESCGFRYMKEIDPGYYLNGRTDLGNTQPGDGPRYRGCGPLQLSLIHI